MRIVIAGSSGLIGTELVTSLRSDGHEVIKLVRRKPAASSEVYWNPAAGEIDSSALVGCDVIINLAGAGVGDRRWSNSYKELIRSSRVDTTSLLAETAADLKLKVFIAGSAIGWYGDTADRQVDETSPPGEGFLAEVVVAWETASKPARDAGVRVVNIRTGLVASKHGGAWAKLLPIFKFGAGGKLGSGKQYWSFISMRDEIAAIKFLIDSPNISGPVNLTAPQPATNTEVTKAMAKVFKRPALFPVPAFALKTILGEFSQEVLGSSRVIPKVLLDNGFKFADPDIESAMRTLATK
ncbi:unannotated protein [freshwater metagenome]|uniref:Unannotated protein n=1 Tax=freshwater metagenome TaxID=449393 RepID=A0A6J6TBY6_9ZZZZ|nr:TIGR01777 family protein [Actinomycetota bacterium]MSW24807.1 TIGR01777 family protein [Actinomycetota bacterium]MSX29541.1 TIGR01777 family protein [Actinomycetota bacterium]MSX43268.1 TIGR01777 family protein [Actinomycetota bacterium]MSX97536.1 TIGR01777 family protein [Actinomycetota bacterium]